MRLVFKSQRLLWVAWCLTGYAMAAPVPLEEAAGIYSENCAVCHGERGDGQSRARFGLDPQPRDFTSAVAASELDRQRMINSVTHGRPDTAMVAWQGRLTEAQIEGVVDYIRATFMALAPVVEGGMPRDTRLVLGKSLYEEHCRVCHGDRGNGAAWTSSVLNPPPRNFTSPQARRILTRPRMLSSVTYGRQQTAMMAFAERLSQEEIEAVVDYIRETFMKGPVIADAGIADLAGTESADRAGHGAGGGHPQIPGSIGAGMAPRLGKEKQVSTVDMNAVMPMELTGDYDRGRKFYADNCFTCHGSRGDGLGPRSSFIEPKPRNFLNADSRSRLNRPNLFNAIIIGIPGTVMPAWGKVLSPQQVADVAEYVYQDFIHPNPDEIQPRAEPEAILDKKKAP